MVPCANEFRLGNRYRLGRSLRQISASTDYEHPLQLELRRVNGHRLKDIHEFALRPDEACGLVLCNVECELTVRVQSRFEW